METEHIAKWGDAGASPSQEAMRDHLLTALLQDGADLQEDQKAQLEHCEIHFHGDWFGLIELQVVAVDAYTYIRGLGHTAYSEAQLTVNIMELLRQELETRPGVFIFKIQSEILCLLCGKDQITLESEMATISQNLAALEQRIDGIRLFLAVSSVGQSLACLGDKKQEIRQLFEYRAIHLSSVPVLHASVLANPVAYPLLRKDILKEQEILSLFKSGRYRQASALFGSLFEVEYLTLANPLMLLKHKCAQYLDAMVMACQEMMDQNIQAEIQALAPERILLAAQSYPEVRAQMEHFFGHLNDLVLAGRKTDSAAWIMDVKNYIRGNYNDPDLNVNRVADEFQKNPSYLSRSFLRLTGTSILDYIHYYRIQEAKILIGRGETLSTVAAAVGYTNVLTMSRAFKKYEGTTPGKLKG